MLKDLTVLPAFHADTYFKSIWHSLKLAKLLCQKLMRLKHEYDGRRIAH